MCPACAASAAWIVGGVMSTGGVTALAVKILGNKKQDVANDSEQRSEDQVDGDEHAARKQEFEELLKAI